MCSETLRKLRNRCERPLYRGTSQRSAFAETLAQSRPDCAVLELLDASVFTLTNDE
jgi:hypothetical protein